MSAEPTEPVNVPNRHASGSNSENGSPGEPGTRSRRRRGHRRGRGKNRSSQPPHENNATPSSSASSPATHQSGSSPARPGTPIATDRPTPSTVAAITNRTGEASETHTTSAPPPTDGAKPASTGAARGRRRRKRRGNNSNDATTTTENRAKNDQRSRGGKAAAAKGPRMRTVRETSAGGLVVQGLDGPPEDRCAALIGREDRRGRMMWSLPKGHIETGETAIQTAVREVSEETGITGAVVAELGKIEYWFVNDGKRIHKTVHHYLLRSLGGELSDADYEVAQVAWVPLTELPRKLTYTDERRLARAAEAVIDGLCTDPKLVAAQELHQQRTEPNDYEKAAAARNERRNDPPPTRRRRRRGGRGRRNNGGSAHGTNQAAQAD